MKLNLGSGIGGFNATPHIKDTWCWKNIDVCEHYNAHEHYDIATGIRERDGSIEEIWMGDCFEHVMRWKSKFVLAECARVLRPDGILTVSVPDMNIVMSKWLANDGMDDDNTCLIWGQQDEQTGRNSIPDAHLNGFTEKSLRKMMTGVGFRNIERVKVHGTWFELALRAIK